jgi:hypothetical protein
VGAPGATGSRGPTAGVEARQIKKGNKREERNGREKKKETALFQNMRKFVGWPRGRRTYADRTT